MISNIIRYLISENLRFFNKNNNEIFSIFWLQIYTFRYCLPYISLLTLNLISIYFKNLSGINLNCYQRS